MVYFYGLTGPEFPSSGHKDAFNPSGAKGGAFMWGIYFLLS